MSKKKVPFQIRQGDVFVEAIESVPKKVSPVPKEDGRVVLAHGEATGHAHAFSRSAKVTMVRDETDRRFMRMGGVSALGHEEHGAIELPAGRYEVIRQVEYSPEAIRQVED